MRHRNSPALIAGALAALSLAAAPSLSTAQCSSAWLAAHNGSALSGSVRAITLWDSDGPGPRPALPVVGGSFAGAGAVALNNLAAWTENGWLPIAGGTAGGQLTGQVSALAVLPNGHLIAAGLFTSAGGVAAANIARFDGQTWHPLAAGLTGQGNATLGGVRALLVLPNGDLIAGGDFTASGATPLSLIARWDGTAWSALGTGMTRQGGMVYAPAVFALAQTSTGDIVAAGQWTHAGGVPATHIARWDGDEWLPMASGFNAYVTALVSLPGGDVVAGGEFTLSGATGLTRIARWNGTAWAAMGNGLDATVRGLTLDSSGAVVAAGFFLKSGNTTVNRVARWTGAAWSAMATGLNGTALVCAPLPGNEVGVGGAFTSAGTLAVKGLARWSTAGEPWLAAQPVSIAAPCGAAASLSVTPAPGFLGITYQWSRDGVPIAIEDNPTAHSATLAIEPLTPALAGAYDCLVTGPCASVASTVAAVSFSAPCCAADFDENGFVNGVDFDTFVEAYESGLPEADVNDDTFVTGEDFDFFTDHFVAGC